jgi:general secretion pathway protein D
MKRKSRFAVIPCAAALGMSLLAQTKPQTPSQPEPAPQTSATQQAAPADAQQKPEKTEKPKKVSRHNRHEAEKMFQAGAQAIVQNDPLTAEKDFLKAHDLDPNNERYPLSAEVARQFVITQTVQKAEKARLLGHSDLARAALAEVAKLDPGNPMIVQHLNELADEATAGLPEMQERGDDLAPPIELAPEKAVRSFHLRTDEQSLIRQVLNAYGIQSTLDPSVKSQIVRFDVDDVGFAQAATMLKLVTNTFFSPLDPIHVVVAADTKENREKYEHQAMEVVYFPGLNPTELSEMGSVARNIFGAEHGLVQSSENTMTIRAPGTTLAALNQTYTELLSGRSELTLEVRMYEIDKSHEKNVGVILPSSTTVFNIPSELDSVIANNSSLVQEIISSGLASAGDYSAIAAILVASGALTGTVFNTPFATFGGGLTATGVELNGASANMLLNSSSVRSIDKLQLRVTDQEEATVRSGERYPILTSSYSSLTPTSSIPSSLLSSLGLSSSALGSSTSQIIPQVQYQDLGLTLTVKPHIEGERDVSLNLSLKLDSLQGSTINSIPVLNNRQYTGTISLRPGDSAMVASAISKTESLEINGIPGLSDIPGLQDATNRDNMVDTTELVIVVTPHIVRLAHRETAGRMMLLPQHP